MAEGHLTHTGGGGEREECHNMEEAVALDVSSGGVFSHGNSEEERENNVRGSSKQPSSLFLSLLGLGLISISTSAILQQVI